MTAPTFTATRPLRAAPERIWRSLVEARLVDQYYLAPLHLLEARLEGRILYGSREQTLVFGKITAWQPFAHLAHSFNFSPGSPACPDLPPDPETSVSYSIAPLPSGCELTLLHEGFPAENQTFRNIQSGWPYILDGLQKTAESLPQPPAELQHGPVLLDAPKFVPAKPSHGFAPYFRFGITVQGQAVGHLNLRLAHSDHILQYAGHVGFDIVPIHRGNRYAFHACLAVAPFARAYLPGCVITCDPDNHASRQTIELVGGRFINEVSVPPDDPHYAHGSRRKLRYSWLADETSG